MHDAFDESDLLRFIEGDCSPDEAAALQAWIAADPRRGELLDELRTVWRLTGTTRDWDLSAARERLQQARFPSRSRSIIPLRRPPPKAGAPPASWALRIAVGIAVLIAGSGLWRLLPRSPQFREYATAPGQRSQLTFLDGTQVLLGVDSRLRVPRDYGVRERTVELEGEAYFIVRHDPGRRFVVRTVHGTTEDLGTEFDVRAYREEHLQVVVAAGMVALRGGGADSVLLTLQPRDRGVIDARGVATRTRGVAVENYTAWTRGALRFDDAPLRSVALQLARWYDLDIELSDSSLAAERLTISFGTKSADEALTALAAVLDVRFIRAGRAVRLLPLHPTQ